MSLQLMMSTMNKVINHSMDGLRNNDNNNNNNNKMMMTASTASTASDGVGVPTVVLTVEVHCMGCARKIIRSVKCLEGVDSVTVDVDRNKVTVVGEVDHLKIIDRIEMRIHKKITSYYTCTIEKKNKEVKPEKTVKMKINGGECIHKIRRAVSSKIKGLKLINLNLLLDSCVHKAENNLDLQHADKMSVEQEKMIMEKDDVEMDGDDEDTKKTSKNDDDVTAGEETTTAENDGDYTQDELPNSNHHCAEIEIEIEKENDGDCIQEELPNSNCSWAELENDGDYTQKELPNSDYNWSEIENETYNVFSDENANACSMM